MYGHQGGERGCGEVNREIHWDGHTSTAKYKIDN